jgi:hypothetical protein
LKLEFLFVPTSDLGASLGLYRDGLGFNEVWREGDATVALALPGSDVQLLDAIYAGQPFRTVLRDLDLTPNQVWGLAKTDEGWSTALESALLATRRDDLEHGTNAAYVAGCVCRECREHQRVRMARIVSS